MKKNRLWFLGFFLLTFAAATVCQASPEADRLGDEALDKIENGNADQGIAQLKRVIEADPENPSWHMNYGSVLFHVGRKMVQQGQKESSQPILKDSEKELFTAVRLFQRKDNLQKAQCYFLIGDLYSYARGQKEIARSYYQKALEYSPQHEGALNAIKNLTTPKE